MRKRVDEAWRAFEAALLPTTAGPTQRREMRRAFHAGAFCVIDELAGAMSNEDEMTSDDERVMIDLAMERELYLADLKAGRA